MDLPSLGCNLPAARPPHHGSPGRGTPPPAPPQSRRWAIEQTPPEHSAPAPGCSARGKARKAGPVRHKPHLNVLRPRLDVLRLVRQGRRAVVGVWSSCTARTRRRHSSAAADSMGCERCHGPLMRLAPLTALSLQHTHGHLSTPQPQQGTQQPTCHSAPAIPPHASASAHPCMPLIRPSPPQSPVHAQHHNPRTMPHRTWCPSRSSRFSIAWLPLNPKNPAQKQHHNPSPPTVPGAPPGAPAA